MEHRRPLRVQKKEEILKYNPESDAKHENTINTTHEIVQNTLDISDLSENDTVTDNETASEDDAYTNNSRSTSRKEHGSRNTSGSNIYSRGKQSTEKSSGVESKHTKQEEKHRHEHKHGKNRNGSTGAVMLAVAVLVYYWYTQRMYNKVNVKLEVIEKIKRELEHKVDELETVLSSKYKEVDVADYTEGARVIHEITTPAYEKRTWMGKKIEGYGGELAIDKVCTKGHCYSYNGAEGKLGIAFKTEKVIRKVGISHPMYDNRTSAVKRFSVHCIVNNKEEKAGEYEYEIPGDTFQQFVLKPVKCTGIVVRVMSNHGNKDYTCIYKVHAYE